MTKVVRAGTNTMVMPLMMPGMLSGSMILKKVCTDLAPKISCCIDDVVVDFDQGIVNRQHHKRQKVVYHAKHDGIREC